MSLSSPSLFFDLPSTYAVLTWDTPEITLCVSQGNSKSLASEQLYKNNAAEDHYFADGVCIIGEISLQTIISYLIVVKISSMIS